ncbi:MAG: MFS transporter [Rhodospirillales bacterium]|nr:MFS transporter [Rhodospirillales bacterium]
MPATDQTDHDKVPFQLQLPVYVVAFFTGNLNPMAAVIMPLWALELGASPLIIGLIISARQILTVTLSIHGGAMLDRYGPRQVIIVLGLVGAATMGLFPLFPVIWAAILLQMVSGFAEGTNWIGTQALVGRLLKGHAVFAGRMTASARVGGFIGPVATGYSWEIYGPAGGFAVMSAWIVCGVAASVFLPDDRTHAPEAPRDAAPIPGRSRASNVMPKLNDYKTAFRLLLLPAVAVVIAATVMRQTGTGMQSSFYGVWLKDIGFSAGTIGLLIGIGNCASAVSALTIGPITRRFSKHWPLLWTVVLAISAIAITPMLDTLELLIVAIVLRGIGQGLNLPLMMTIGSQAVGFHLQGRMAALRISFNRFGGAMVPLGTGALAEVIGLEYAFYTVGVLGVSLVGLLALWVFISKPFEAEQTS